jgi:DNA-binding NtrC family response regulator
VAITSGTKKGGLGMSMILVVDDDDNIRNILCDLISLEHECQAAQTAEEALANMEVATYDLVLTDISMPGLSGLELLGHIKQRYPDTTVIVISGISDQEYAHGMSRLGAFEYLLKPFSLESVMESVQRALNQRSGWQQDKQRNVTEDSGTEWTIVRGSR